MTNPAKNPGYETRDALIKPLGVFAVLLAVMTVAAFWASRLLENRFEAGASGKEAVHPLMAERRGPDAPLLQPTTGDDLVAHRAHEEHVLGTYGWVDRDAGVIRVPIEHAMELFVERYGGPARPATNDETPEPAPEAPARSVPTGAPTIDE